MKLLNAIFLIACFASALRGVAQTKTVTLTAVAGQTSSYNCSTNQVITINSFLSWNYCVGTATILFSNGSGLALESSNYGLNILNCGVFNDKAIFTGVTNIALDYNQTPYSAVLTFTITTPTDQSVLPVNTVVIPSDAKGAVQIVLESSSDLINWTPSLPGTYGNTYTNRFFRVRAIAQ